MNRVGLLLGVIVAIASTSFIGCNSPSPTAKPDVPRYSSEQVSGLVAGFCARELKTVDEQYRSGMKKEDVVEPISIGVLTEGTVYKGNGLWSVKLRTGLEDRYRYTTGGQFSFIFDEKDGTISPADAFTGKYLKSAR